MYIERLPALILLGLLVITPGACRAAYGAETEWRVGLAHAGITPEKPIAMSGYGRRVSSGVLDELEAKAMVIENVAGGRAVLLTADLLFFRAPFADVLCKQITERTGLQRSQILLNASHTHSGPVFGVKDPDRFQLTENQRKVIDAYTDTLKRRLVGLVTAAMADMKPARLSWGVGKAHFVINRRLISPEGKCRGMGLNPQGLVDRNVPVLRVDGPDGRLRAVVFGCACHPVTLGGGNLKISGDYPSFTQKYIQKHFPETQAMFVIGCGADANSHPRGGAGQEQLVRKHGKSLGAEVCRVLATKLQPIHGPLRVELNWTDLPLQHNLSRQRLQEIAKGPYWHARNARGMLAMLDRNEPLPTHYRAAVALWQFGDDLTLVGLPGEAVAEYVPMIEKALGPERLWVAAYCNESFGYLPSAKVVAEGGHEAIGLTLAIGFFSADAQDVVVATVRQLAQKVGRRLPR